MNTQLIYFSLGLLLLVQIIALLTLRGLLHRLQVLVVAYRTGGKPKKPNGDDDDGQDDGGGNPLGDVFRRYSLLTDRMADLIFELTVQRNNARNAAMNQPPAPESQSIVDQWDADRSNAASGLVLDVASVDADPSTEMEAALSDTVKSKSPKSSTPSDKPASGSSRLSRSVTESERPSAKSTPKTPTDK